MFQSSEPCLLSENHDSAIGRAFWKRSDSGSLEKKMVLEEYGQRC